jgi:conjugal transfer pilus assembly protein TraB
MSNDNPQSPLTPTALRNQMIRRTTIVVVAAGLLVWGMIHWLQSSREQQATHRQEQAKAHVILRSGDEAQDWRLKEGAKVDELSKSIEQQTKTLEGIHDQMEQMRKQAAQQARTGGPSTTGTPSRRSGGQPPVPPLDEILPPPTKPGKKTPSAEADVSASAPQQPSPPAPPPLAPKAPTPVAPTQSASTPATTGRLRVITPRMEGRGAKKDTQMVGWLPSGSFIHGALLSGVDAGTGTGSNLPYPVLIRLHDPAILPNHQKMDLAECFVIGAAFGDLPSERVFIRTETLSCVRKSGGMVTIDGEIKGHAIGEDGKVGLRGRVVAKEGTLIARSLVAGFLSGLGQAFKPRITVTPLQLGGTTDTTKAFQLPPLGDTLEAAGVSGVGRSMELLSGYYLQQLQKIFPIIEIDAGRQVDIMILKGMPLRFNVQRTAATSAQEVVE